MISNNSKSKRFSVITLFPESCQGYSNSSILKRAQDDNKIKVDYFNPRDYTTDTNHRIDQKPYGGGPGMVLEAEPFLLAWQEAVKPSKGIKKLTELVTGKQKNTKTIFFSPSGKQFDQQMAIDLASSSADLVFICGRYEGIDQRVVDITGAESVSVGPYVLTGGELPALIMIDAIARQIPGVLGDNESLEENRIASPAVYTRPEHLDWQGKTHSVPPVLLSGNHAEIDKWRSESLD